MNFIFIVGAPRSGTTWLQALLASHPQVITGQETHFFSALSKFIEFYKKRDDWRVVGLPAYWPEEKEYDLWRLYFLEFIKPVLKNSEKKDIKYFLEKTPEHVFHIPLISKIFPDSKFIHLIRDARHVVASLKRVFELNGRYISPTVAALVWKNCVSSGISFGRTLPQDRYFELKYENLRINTISLLSDIFSWLNLEYDHEMLREIIEKCSLSKLKKQKKFDTIKTIYKEPEGFFGTGSINQNFSLTKLEISRVYDICGPLMKDLGYIEKVPKISFLCKLQFSYKIRKLLGLKEI
ncbi:sulfotransferase [Thermodesulfatator indicus DSM 15286]|uniref:Sulfotransferase n=1 Tax=Thermodesulfatator indicus (strain DSM 15286 / JCM 11887 / CIR29812) TaxID=667014 RepID=F8ABL1_THEID|nr:sulfotransferase [Thermodesulfatator indicus]AEH45610.1 sulfotransferase [Thermodesulfatator indicus DSM 15286]